MDQLPDDRQPQPDPAEFPGGARIDLVKSLENFGKLFRLDADAGIPDRNLYPFFLRR